MPELIAFAHQRPDPVHDRPRPDRLISGNPLRTTWNHFTNSSGELDAGIWSCETGAWTIAFAPNKDEFFCVIEGRIRITDNQGRPQEFGPGDACVIPAGFVGTFEVLEPVRKHYVVLERRP